MLKKLFFRKREAQGAVEYLLMLAAVLVIVAVAVYYVVGMGKGPVIAGNATYDGDNLFFKPTTGLSPAPMPYDWEWAVYSGGSAVSGMDFAANGIQTTDMAVGETIPLSSGVTTDITGDELRIRCKGKLFTFTIEAE